MFKRLLPQQVDFCEFFESHSSIMVQAAAKLKTIIDSQIDRDIIASEIGGLEHEADLITHRCLNELHRTFITPFDRSDIYRLIIGLDDVIDDIHKIATHTLVYELGECIESTKLLANVLHEACIAVNDSVKCLRKISDLTAFQRINIQIHRLENQGDDIFHEGLRVLFREEKDPIALIKRKEILELIERSIDDCENVADRIQNILLEAA